MSKFQVFVIDRRKKNFLRRVENITFDSFSDEPIRSAVNRFCFKSAVDFIPGLPFVIKIDGKEVHYFDSNYNPFYFDYGC